MSRIHLADESIEHVRSAALDRSAVSGATHRFYRYPARFSPQFARAAIEAFTEVGDMVLDPFVGGGTTAVEALRSGRRCVGTDINELAIFVSQTKSTVLTEDETSFLRAWTPTFRESLKMSRNSAPDGHWREKGYLRHIEHPETWRHRNLIGSALNELALLSDSRLQNFVRCVVLRSAQLSLDGRRSVMTVPELRSKLLEHLSSMLLDMDDMRAELEGSSRHFSPKILKQDSKTLHCNEAVTSEGPPKLILTSPPYPGVHVLYHRWQVNGRRETPAPYWIANKLDGDGERYYTLGNRHERDLKTYFENLEKIYSALAKISDKNTIFVQMVAFSTPEWQLPRYLNAMEAAGLTEITSSSKSDPRIWRDVPNRKWHAERQTNRASSREVVLFHKLS